MIFFFPSVHFQHSHPMCATSGWWFGQPSSTWTSLWGGGQNYCREFGKRSLMIMLQTSKNENSKVHSQAVLNTHRKTDTDSLFLSLTPIYSPCLPTSVPETLGPLREIYYGLFEVFSASPPTTAKYGPPPHSKLSAYYHWCDLAMWKVAAEHQGRVESLELAAMRKLVGTSKAYVV